MGRTFLECRIVELETENAKLRDDSEQLACIRAASSELVDILRDKWACPDMDAVTLHMAAFTGAISDLFVKENPKHGFIHSLRLPAGDLVLELQVRKAGGKTAEVVMREQVAEIEGLRKELEEIRAEGEDKDLYV